MSILNLLNYNEFIASKNVKEVKSTAIFSPGGSTFDPNGRWSEEIFGRVGSNDRKERFGYVDLGTTIINPTVYSIILSSSPIMRRIILNISKYEITDGKFIESELGSSGILFLIENLKNFSFMDIVKKDKVKVGQFLDENKKLISIDKYLILPAGIRDMSLTKSQFKQFTSEINEYYEKLISISNQMQYQTDIESKEMFTSYIQKITLQIYKWLQNNVKGKSGVFRSSMLKKTLDYSARIIATSDPNIPLGKIGLPWHTIITIFEPFFFNYVLYKDKILQNEICKEMKLEETGYIDFDKLKLFATKITKDPDNIPSELKLLLIKCAEDISSGKQVLCKRDPVVSRSAYYSAEIVVMKTGRAAVVNSLTVSPQGLDFDGDQLAILPVLTIEANKEAEKLNPAKTKSAWIDPLTLESHHYTLTLDSISTIYTATLQ